MRSTTSFCSMKWTSCRARARRGQVKQQRRGDVVGQIADHPQSVTERSKVEVERVLLHDRQPLRRELAPQRARRGRDRSRPRAGGAPARAAVASAHRVPDRSRPSGRPAAERSRDDAIEHSADRPESSGRSACVRRDAIRFLAPNAAHSVHLGGARRALRCASSIASSIAATRLPGSARAACQRDRARCRDRPRCGRSAGRA